jgi:hypothetical protein
VALALDGVVHVHVHELEDQSQSTSGFIVEHLIELDDLGVRTQSSESLDLPEVVDLLDGVEVVLHALDGDVLARLDALGLEHL